MATLQNANTHDNDEKGWHTLVGELCEFGLGDDSTVRQWFMVNLTFAEADKVFVIEPYDPVRGKGVQRPAVDSHIKKLKRAELEGTYSPAPWTVGVYDAHLKNLTIDDEKKGRTTRKVTLRVHDRNPLPCLDGGHRFRSLKALRDDNVGNKEMLAKIDALTISATVYLQPKFISKDFRNLQAGKAVSRSLLAVMSENDKDKKEDKNTPFKRIAQRVAALMDAAPENESFLSQNVNFGTTTGQGMVEYASITTLSASDIGTSIGGGAKIVLYDGFKQFLPTEDVASNFLAECYKAAYQGIYKYGDKHESVNSLTNQKESFPTLLMPGKMLRPNRLKGGTKGGTGYLCMLGNMLAFRMLAIRKKPEIPGPEVKRLIEAVAEILDMENQGGGSGTAKRQATGEFVRYYFRDSIREGDKDEHDTKKIGGIDGVPSMLIDILSRSTLNVDVDAVPFIPADHVSGPENEDDSSDNNEWSPESIEETEEFTPPPPKSGKNKAATGTMG